MNLINRRFRYTFFNAALGIALINVVVWLIVQGNPQMNLLLGLNPYLFLHKHMYWQIFTYMFMHGDFMHLFCNMFGLLMFGISVERAAGSKEFLLMFFLCGIVDGLLSLGVYVLTGSYGVLLIGASGAVYSILLAFAVIYPTAKIFLFGILPIPAPMLIVIYAVIEIWDELFGMAANVAHMTHLFGFAAAWIYFIVRMGINPLKVWKDAWR